MTNSSCHVHKAKTLFDQETDLSFNGHHDNTILANDIGEIFYAEDRAHSH